MLSWALIEAPLPSKSSSAFLLMVLVSVLRVLAQFIHSALCHEALLALRVSSLLAEVPASPPSVAISRPSPQPSDQG